MLYTFWYLGKKCVFNAALNLSSLSVRSRRLSGREFQVIGPTTEQRMPEDRTCCGWLPRPYGESVLGLNYNRASAPERLCPVDVCPPERYGIYSMLIRAAVYLYNWTPIMNLHGARVPLSAELPPCHHDVKQNGKVLLTIINMYCKVRNTHT